MWPDGNGPQLLGRGSSSSEVVVIDDRGATAAVEYPAPSEVNVVRSSRVHIGPKFVSVNQTIQNSEVVKGRLLCLELVSPKNSRLRCSVAVFVCWALIVTCALGVYLIVYTLRFNHSRMDIGLTESWYLRRANWQALPAYTVDFLNLPVQNIIFTHSAGLYCNNVTACIIETRTMQNDHFQRRLLDIGPNFVVGGNGIVLEARGANVEPAVVPRWNRRSVIITFLGDYTRDIFDDMQIEHVKILIDTLLKERIVRQDYVLYGHCQIITNFISPGKNIMDRIHVFKHWNSENASTCLRG